MHWVWKHAAIECNTYYCISNTNPVKANQQINFQLRKQQRVENVDPTFSLVSFLKGVFTNFVI